MSQFFFSGSVSSKVDDKNRFVLPQAMRYGLIENGKLEFTIALGLDGCLAIYRKSDIEKIVTKFKAKQHIARYRKFFTLFFSTLHHTSCDKLGRVLLPPLLKKAAGIKGEIVVAGVLDKIEIWAKEKYEADLEAFFDEEASTSSHQAMMQEAFAMLNGEEKDQEIAELSQEERVEYQEI